MEPIQFKELAPHYDDLMSGVPYQLWVKYLESILHRVNISPKTILDVACGTGTVTRMLANKGYDVKGVDIAEGMIKIAREKDPLNADNYYVQDISEMDIDGQFDLAVSLFDSLNYITDTQKLAKAIKQVGIHLNTGGVFIFDVNTIYALSNHFFDQASLTSDHYPKYIWNSSYDNKTRICTVNMVFETLENGQHNEFKEVHIQKGYTLEELSQMLIDASFEVVDIFHAYRFKKPTRRSDRVFFVARKL